MNNQLMIQMDDAVFTVSLENNDAAKAFLNLLAEDLTVKLSRYGGFEQVGPLGTSLPSDDKRITAVSGDIMLYMGNQIVLFYGNNTWSYTPLGKINATNDELYAALGKSDVTVRFFFSEE